MTPVQEENSQRTYQASSPDEIALVKFAESINLILEARDINSITLKTPTNHLEEYEVLNVFPFTSETKRMGIIVRNKENGSICFYMKGADTVMAEIVQYNDWLEEECGNMAREGLRTLVFGKKNLTQEGYNSFAKRFVTQLSIFCVLSELLDITMPKLRFKTVIIIFKRLSKVLKMILSCCVLLV